MCHYCSLVLCKWHFCYLSTCQTVLFICVSHLMPLVRWSILFIFFFLCVSVFMCECLQVYSYFFCSLLSKRVNNNINSNKQLSHTVFTESSEDKRKSKNEAYVVQAFSLVMVVVVSVSLLLLQMTNEALFFSLSFFPFHLVNLISIEAWS